MKLRGSNSKTTTHENVHVRLRAESCTEQHRTALRTATECCHWTDIHYTRTGWSVLSWVSYVGRGPDSISGLIPFRSADSPHPAADGPTHRQSVRQIDGRREGLSGGDATRHRIRRKLWS